jgi:hypothetical protein
MRAFFSSSEEDAGILHKVSVDLYLDEMVALYVDS